MTGKLDKKGELVPPDSLPVWITLSPITDERPGDGGEPAMKCKTDKDRLGLGSPDGRGMAI
jgi:hypothetical protein